MGTCRWLKASVIAAAIGGLANVSSAQTQPAEDASSTSPQVVSPYWGQPYSAYPQSPIAGEPTVEKAILAVPQARADAVAAKWSYRRLDRELNITSSQMRRDFRQSEQYDSAVVEFKNAYAALEAARRGALRDLVGTPEYIAITELRADVNEQLADEKFAAKPDFEKVAALAELKMENITPVRAAEIELLSNDSGVRDAKARLIQAARALTQLEREFVQDVRESIDLASIRKSRADAKIAMLASAAYLEEIRRARDLAITYSLTSQFGPDDNDARYRRGYSSCGYGYGYVGGLYRGGFSGVGNIIAGGFVGNTSFGKGSNAFFGRSGNAFFGRGGNAFIGPAAGVQTE
jgi:hypothetical protein